MAELKPGQIVQTSKALKNKGPGSDRDLAKGTKFKIDWVRGGQVCADPVNPKDEDKGFYFKPEELNLVEGKKASMKITASDRNALIKLASSLPKGDDTRKAILAGLKKTAMTTKSGLNLHSIVSNLATARYEIGHVSSSASIIVYVEDDYGSLNENLNIHFNTKGMFAMDPDGHTIPSSKVGVDTLMGMSEADIAKYLLKWLPDAQSSSQFTIENYGF